MMWYVNAVYLNEGGADDSAGVNHGVVWFICGDTIQVTTSTEKRLNTSTRLSEHQPNEEANSTTLRADDPTRPLCVLIFLCNRPEQC